MEIIEIDSNSKFNIENFVALGNFDGVHLGHRELIKKVVEASKKYNKKASALIFKEHTKNTINQNKQYVLTSIKERYNLLEELGIDYIFEMEFNKDVMKMEPEKFIIDLLIKNLSVKGIFVGFDYRFGHKAKGDTDLIEEIGHEYGLKLEILEPVYYDEQIISSTLIRKYICDGDIESAKILLKRNFYITGHIVHGKRLGTKMGYPTANIQLDADYITPAFGVYDTNILVEGKWYKAATSVGTNPTLDEQGIKIEAHILDFKKDIYGEFIKLEFLEFLRPELKFDTIEELFLQIKTDTLKVANRKN